MKYLKFFEFYDINTDDMKDITDCYQMLYYNYLIE